MAARRTRLRAGKPHTGHLVPARACGCEAACHERLPATPMDFSDAEIEAGRRLFAGRVELCRRGRLARRRCRRWPGPEIAFAGRSNVGKSSLDQCAHRPSGAGAHLQHAGPHPGIDLLRRPASARAGRHAGLRLRRRGQEQDRRLDEARSQDYLHGRATLARVYRAGRCAPWAESRRRAPFSTRSARPPSATRSFSPNATRSARRSWPSGSPRIAAAMRKRPAAFPDLIATSAKSGAGIARLARRRSRGLLARAAALTRHIAHCAICPPRPKGGMDAGQ